jgi:hypothetical protein
VTNVPLGLLLALQSSPAPQATAANILLTLIGTEDRAPAVSYIVRREYLDDDGHKRKGRSTVLLQKTPFRARAEHYGEGGSFLDITLSDEISGRTFLSSSRSTPTTRATSLPIPTYRTSRPTSAASLAWRLRQAPSPSRCQCLQMLTERLLAGGGLRAKKSWPRGWLGFSAPQDLLVGSDCEQPDGPAHGEAAAGDDSEARRDAQPASKNGLTGATQTSSEASHMPNGFA